MNEWKKEKNTPRLMIFPCCVQSNDVILGEKSLSDFHSFVPSFVLLPMKQNGKEKYHELGVIVLSSSGTFISVTITGKNIKHAKNSLTLIACLPEEAMAL